MTQNIYTKYVFFFWLQLWLKLTCRLRLCLKTKTILRSKIVAYINSASLDLRGHNSDINLLRSLCQKPNKQAIFPEIPIFDLSHVTLWDDHFSPKQATALTLTKLLSFNFHFWFMRHHHRVIFLLPRDTLALAPPEATGSLWRKGELVAGILYILVEKAPGCILIYFHPYTRLPLCKVSTAVACDKVLFSRPVTPRGMWGNGDEWRLHGHRF